MDTNSKRIFERACKVMPGGVNSPVRSFSHLQQTPIVMHKGKGSRITDVDGNEYIDFCGSWGPLILGHAHPLVLEAIHNTINKGLTFGTCHPLETELAEEIISCVKHFDMVRFVNSGTEAVMTAVRMARGITGRSKLLKFEGCYHGHVDQLLIKAGSGLLNSGVPTSQGIPTNVSENTIVVEFNNMNMLEQVFQEFGNELAGVIIEPVAGNMGFVQADLVFLHNLRRLTRKHNCLLIFDEVITGFRFARTTYGQLIDIDSDLTCLGKIIGGGMPVGAIGGKKEYMQSLAPLGGVYQAGTLSGNPVAMAAGLATLRALKTENPYPKIKELGDYLQKSLHTLQANLTTPFVINQLASAFTIFWSLSHSPKTFAETQLQSTILFKEYFQYMCYNGIYLPPSAFETAFISLAHTTADIDIFIEATKNFLHERTIH